MVWLMDLNLKTLGVQGDVESLDSVRKSVSQYSAGFRRLAEGRAENFFNLNVNFKILKKSVILVDLPFPNIHVSNNFLFDLRLDAMDVE